MGTRGMQIIFGIGLFLLILFIAMGTVLPELNRHTYEGIVTEKYQETHAMTTGKTQFIELKTKDGIKKIENSDILLHYKMNSRDLQKDIKEGKPTRVKTIGFNIPSLGLYPNLYDVEQSE
ncbi:hypothetical protein HHH54_10740 [Staphylococcus sp. H16/1A]|uniref:Phage protein n=2 Tax=Staphylococcus canis TaxID=2724942 RepID=A0ABS0TBC1_9STAP|nr:hypothetical protein [Staphylococcus canis]